MMTSDIRELDATEMDVVSGGFAPIDIIVAIWNKVQAEPQPRGGAGGEVCHTNHHQ